MAEHLSQQQIHAFQQQRLTPIELLTVDEHLSTCSSCRARLEAALPASVPALYTELQPEVGALAAVHPDFVQLAGMVDETLAVADRQYVTDHAATCAQCAQALADLRAFNAAPQTHPVRVDALTESNWRDKLRAFVWPPNPALAWGMAALLLLVLAGGWLRALWQPKSDPQLAGPTAAPSVVPSPLPETTPALTAPPALARLNDGNREITLDHQGRLTGLDELPPAHQQLVREALLKRQVTPPANLAELNRRGSSLMGADETGNRFSLSAPAGQVVLTNRPAFRWTPLAGASSYVVEIYDEQFNLAAQSPELTGTTWTPAHPLTRGRTYTWQVKARKDGQEIQAPKPPAPQARFRILSQAQAQEIAGVRRTHSDLHLLLGLLYARAGLLDEAARELRALQRANPQSELARQLAANLTAQRP